MRKIFYSIIFISSIANAQKTSEFNGLNMSPGNLFLLSNAKTISISPENLTGEHGKGGDQEGDADSDQPAGVARAAGQQAALITRLHRVDGADNTHGLTGAGGQSTDS